MKKIEKNVGEKQTLKEEVVEQQWSKPRLFIAFIILVMLIAAGMLLWPSDTSSLEKSSSHAIPKEYTPPENVKIPTKKDVEQIIQNAQSQLANITSENFTSSTAAIQKVITDLQKLQQGNKETIDIICEYICK